MRIAVILAILVTIIAISVECGRITSNSIYSNDELIEAKGNLPLSKFGATRLKNRIKGPADMGLYYINYASSSCGGLSSSQCSSMCGKLGYPVYWCYPKVCYCHYGALDNEQEDIDVPNLE